MLNCVWKYPFSDILSAKKNCEKPFCLYITVVVWIKVSKKTTGPIFVTFAHPALYARIDARVDMMENSGNQTQ